MMDEQAKVNTWQHMCGENDCPILWFKAIKEGYYYIGKKITGDTM